MATNAHADDLTEQDHIRSALYDRYRQLITAPVPWNDMIGTLLSHRSVRAYLPDALPDGTIETLIAAAQSAASSSNLQPWSVVAVEQPERKARLAALAGHQKHIVDAPLLLLWLIDLDRLHKIGEEQGIPAKAVDFLETFLLGAVDTSLAAQNAVVALESLGLGSVYIGGIRNKPLEVAAELDLPPNVFALFGLVVGYPDPAAPASVKPRLPQEAVLFRERYGRDRYGADVQSGAHMPAHHNAHYNERLRSFQQEQGLPERAWTDIVAQRLRGAEALHGRDQLRDVLTALGFRLK